MSATLASWPWGLWPVEHFHYELDVARDDPQASYYGGAVLRRDITEKKTDLPRSRPCGL